MNAPANNKLSWLLDDLVDRVLGVRHAVVLSADGLLIARSAALPQDNAEKLSAMASALHSLAKGVGKEIDGGAARQTMVELERAYLFVIAAGQGACLAVEAEDAADIGSIAYEMSLLVKQVGAYLSAAPREPEIAVGTTVPVK